MEGVDAARSLRADEFSDALLDLGLGLLELGTIGRDFLSELAGQVIADGDRQYEIAIGQTLHQRARAEAVGSVIGEIRLAPDVESGDRRHQVVVDPQSAHRVMRRRIDTHRHDVRILRRDVLIHLEEVAVALFDDRPAETFNRFREIEIDAPAAGSDAATFIADFLGTARSDVAGREIAEARVLPLEVVIALLLRNLIGAAGVAGSFRHPDAAVVAQRFGHQRQLRLKIAALRDARGMNLRVAGIRKVSAAPIRAPDGGGIRCLCIRR